MTSYATRRTSSACTSYAGICIGGSYNGKETSCSKPSFTICSNGRPQTYTYSPELGVWLHSEHNFQSAVGEMKRSYQLQHDPKFTQVAIAVSRSNEYIRIASRSDLTSPELSNLLGLRVGRIKYVRKMIKKKTPWLVKDKNNGE